MRRLTPYLVSGAAVAASLGTMAWAFIEDPSPSVAAIWGAAGSMVVAMVALSWARVGIRPRWRTLFSGAFVGYVGAAALFVMIVLPVAVFVPSVDRFLRDYLTDPAALEDFDERRVMMFLVVASFLAPVTEEPAKALAGNFARPVTLGHAFIAGVTAGAGFAILEDGLYAAGAEAYGSVWRQVLVLRSLGAPLHPLASGLVLMGVWEWRRRRSLRSLLAGALGGMALHMLWNETVVIAGIVEAGADSGDLAGWSGPAVLGYSGLLGVVLMFVLFKVSGAVGRAAKLVEMEAPVGPAPRTEVGLVGEVHAERAPLLYGAPAGSTRGGDPPPPPPVPRSGPPPPPRAVPEAHPPPVAAPITGLLTVRGAKGPWILLATALGLPVVVLAAVYSTVF